MDFADYARAHGLIISSPITDGQWHRCATVEKPKQRGGTYRHFGTHALFQNHHSMPAVAVWQPDGDDGVKVDREAIQRNARAAAEQIRRNEAEAAKRATVLMAKTTHDIHPYLVAKGFPDEIANVWDDPDDGIRKMVIPMRVDGRLTSVQQIYADPENPGKFVKKFLYGGRTSEAVFVMGTKGPRYYAEGWTTSLSVRAALVALKASFTIYVCFSAANMVKVAAKHGPGMVIADFDRPTELVVTQGGMGWKVARDIGMPWWTSDREGEDFNDFMTRVGLFRCSQSLKAAMMKKETPT